jgi:hypothetical protein
VGIWGLAWGGGGYDPARSRRKMERLGFEPGKNADFFGFFPRLRDGRGGLLLQSRIIHFQSD